MILGLDWGKRKIGVAVAPREVPIATAVDILENDEYIFDSLRTIVDEYDVDTIVMGRSEHLTQSDNVKDIDVFAGECRASLGVEVVFAHEMFSTQEAQKNLKEAGKKRIDQKDDAESARIILQQYIDAELGKM